ncbi:hypothetical protein C8R47DRAFT_921903, partial [Mycena vitilis]
MALPPGVPTLRSFATGNLTRVDNVFCSASLLAAYISCDTEPGLRPVKTDHFPVMQVIDLTIQARMHQPRPLFRTVIWGDFRKHLVSLLADMEHPDHYASVEDLERAIRQLETAVQETVEATVRMSTPSPYMKRWFSKQLSAMKRASSKLERLAYAER